MSRTFHLCCPKCKKEVWIGQGSEQLDYVYTDDDTTVLLEEFLREHMGRPIFVLDLDWMDGYTDYELPAEGKPVCEGSPEFKDFNP